MKSELFKVYNELLTEPNYTELLEDHIDFIRDPKHDKSLYDIVAISGTKCCTVRDAYVLLALGCNLMEKKEGFKRLNFLMDNIGLSDEACEFYILECIDLIDLSQTWWVRNAKSREFGIDLFFQLSLMHPKYTLKIPDESLETIAKYGTLDMIFYFLKNNKISYTMAHKMQLLAMDTNNNKEIAKVLRGGIDSYFS